MNSVTQELPLQSTVSHRALVEVAAAWLRKQGHAIVATEVVTTGETPDAIGWKGTCATLIECKVSRADFLADSAKPFRRDPQRGLGYLRLYLCPTGVIESPELPEGWGLLEWNGDKVRVIKKPEPKYEHNVRQEVSILLSILRRIGQNPPPGVSIRAYTFITKCTATVGIDPLIPQECDPDSLALTP